MKLYSQQEKVINQVMSEFENNNKVLLNAVCAFGKTILTLYLVSSLIKQGKRVAISAYSRREIREQWWSKNLEFNIIPAHLVQVVCKEQDVKDLQSRGVPAISNSNISDTKPLTIFIPQSIKAKAIGKFDYFIVDEAHEFLEVKDGILKKIISECCSEDTKFLGLTGTGFELLKKGAFFDGGSCVIYDMPTALDEGLISDCKIICEYFKFDLKESFYNNRELNKEGRLFLKEAAIVGTKLKNIVDKYKNEKTLVIVPPKTDVKICNYINLILGEDSLLRKPVELWIVGKTSFSLRIRQRRILW